MSSLYDFQSTTNDGKTLDLSSYRGKAVLIVNTASRCGYTPQYEGLEALHKELQAKGLVIIGAPANEFGAQEPGTDEEIQSFCSTKFGVSFTLLAKQVVKGAGQTPLFQWLTANSSPAGEIRWNFEKFLIHRNGTTIERFGSAVKPSDAALRTSIEKALSAP